MTPSGTGICPHPDRGSQNAAAQRDVGQKVAKLTHVPDTQRSALVQTSVSRQSASLRQHPGMESCTQRASVSLQRSVVQAEPSEQSGGGPFWQTPPWQTAMPSQKRPSSHELPSAATRISHANGDQQ